MRMYILFCLLDAAMLSGCWAHIERSQTFTNEKASSIVGKEAKVTLANSTMSEDGTILSITKDSLVLSVMEGSRRNVALTNIKDILIEGSEWGRYIGGAMGAAVVLGVTAKGFEEMHVLGGGSKTSAGTTVLQVTGVLLVVVGLPLLGEYLFTPNWRYSVAPEAPKADGNTTIQETALWSGTNPQYVLVVERFLAETDSTVTIPWQGKAVTLSKSEIAIEKHESGFRITVPARLLK